MFDDFMHNAFPDMHFQQPHQDAMLHAQGQAMNQAARAQQDIDCAISNGHPQAPQPVPPAGVGNAAVNIGMLVQSMIEKLLKGKRP